MLTCAFITARKEPHLDWWLASLIPQIDSETRIVVVDFYAEACWQDDWTAENVAARVSAFRELAYANDLIGTQFVHVPPMPNPFQGPYRLPKDNWWAACTARNTAVCYAPDGWIAYCDDRCVLAPTWIEAVKDALAGNHIVCGTYTKAHGLKVENGVIIGQDKVDAQDSRLPYVHGTNPYPCSGEWLFGCSFALPVEWMLSVNGFDDATGTLSFEDCLFGLMLEKQGYPFRFDTRMAIVQDRTPGVIEGVFKRTDKGVSPNDKSHRILDMVQRGGRYVAPNHFGEGGLRVLRQRILEGGSFPITRVPENDWFDGQPFSEFA